MAPLDSSQLHEHEGGLGFLICEGLIMFVCVSVCRRMIEFERERDRKTEKRQRGRESRERKRVYECVWSHNTTLHKTTRTFNELGGKIVNSNVRFDISGTGRHNLPSLIEFRPEIQNNQSTTPSGQRTI